MIEPQTPNRFDLEQQILECWKVTNDIQVWVNQGAPSEDYKVLIDYYNRKFEQLWATFEGMVHEKKM